MRKRNVLILAAALGLAAGASAVVRAQQGVKTQLSADDLLEKIVRLQGKNIELEHRIAKLYTSNGVCYVNEYECTSERDSLNHMYGLFSHDSEISLSATCQLETGQQGTVCYQHNYVVRTMVKLTPKEKQSK